MKKIFIAVGIIFVLSLGFFNREAIASQVESVVYQSPCEVPRTFSIGTIDSRFGMTEADVIEAAKVAGSLWKNAEGKTIMQYDPDSKLTINLVYDQRQSLNTKVNDLNSQIEEQKNSLKPEIEVYEQRSAAFKKRNNALNERIDYWNNQGGAPEEEYNKLIQEQRALQTEAQQLQAMAATLNQSTDEYNTQVQELDKQVSQFNQTLEQEPEEGEYIRNGRDEKIAIYIVNSRQELLHTLAHEMGHAIGIPHNNNPFSIMYPKTNNIVELSSDDTAALAEVCRKRSVVETVNEKFSLLAQDIRSTVERVLKREPAAN